MVRCYFLLWSLSHRFAPKWRFRNITYHKVWTLLFRERSIIRVVEMWKQGEWKRIRLKCYLNIQCEMSRLKGFMHDTSNAAWARLGLGRIQR